MPQVETTKGLIDRDELSVEDIVSNEPNARVIRTEWFFKGELVRRDVWASILSGHEMTGQQADLG